jgi:ankyrin repeat protein
MYAYVCQLHSLPEMRDQIDRRDRWQRTPLHWAVLASHVEAAELLLSLGASIHLHKESARLAKHATVMSLPLPLSLPLLLCVIVNFILFECPILSFSLTPFLIEAGYRISYVHCRAEGQG